MKFSKRASQDCSPQNCSHIHEDIAGGTASENSVLCKNGHLLSWFKQELSSVL